ncbi:MAG TPA: hypothetical protein VKE88_01950 [Candidatus Nanoarchaeia archaeon]|nr:hypothetical protein [Candidatus Nanoarchaeia archaeon]
MKRGVFLAILLLLSTATYAIEENLGYVESNYNYIHARTLKYEPYPAQPGRYLDVWIRLENTGQEKADIYFNLLPKYPFSIDASEKANRTIMALAGRETSLVHYKVRVDDNAIEGNNLLNYRIKTSDGLIDESSLAIFVQTSDANIAVDSVEGQQITPGIISEVTLQLRNEGDTPLTDVSVKLDLSSDAIPIAPINSTSEKKIYVIEPHSVKPITFQLLALPDATSNTYKVPIEIKFIDGTGKNYTKSSIIGLTVGATPDISITTTDSSIYGKGELGNIALKFTNKGLTDIKLLNVVLNESEAYDIISEDELYLGNIDSDDYETAEFRIKARKVKDGSVPLIVNLDYRDANNKEYHETRIVDLKVVSAKELGVEGNGSGFGTVVFAVIFIGGGYYLYRRWEKKKKLGKK